MHQFLLELIQMFFLKVDTNIRPGDLIHKGDSPAVYEAVGIYYNFQLKPFIFFRDNNGYIYSAMPQECKRVSNPELIHASN